MSFFSRRSQKNTLQNKEQSLEPVTIKPNIKEKGENEGLTGKKKAKPRNIVFKDLPSVGDLYPKPKDINHSHTKTQNQDDQKNSTQNTVMIQEKPKKGEIWFIDTHTVLTYVHFLLRKEFTQILSLGFSFITTLMTPFPVNEKIIKVFSKADTRKSIETIVPIKAKKTEQITNQPSSSTQQKDVCHTYSINFSSNTNKTLEEKIKSHNKSSLWQYIQNLFHSLFQWLFSAKKNEGLSQKKDSD